MKKIKAFLKINISDAGVVAAIVGGGFVLLELVVAIVLLTVGRKSDSTLALGWAILPVVAAFVCLFVNTAQVVVSFDLSLRFGLTRKNALLSTLALMLAESYAAMLLGWLLGELDRLIARGWVLLLPNLTYAEEEWGHFPPAVLLLVPLGVTVLGLGGGALLQRFGLKGFWVLWGAWMVLMVGQKYIMDAIDGITNAIGDASFQTVMWITVPIIAVVVIVIMVLSVWSLMRATVKN